MEDMTVPNGFNMGGIVKYNFILVDDVVSIPEAENGKIAGPVVLVTGGVWSKGYGQRGSTVYSEPEEKTGAGSVFKWLFESVVPKDRTENDVLFYKMRNGGFIIDYTDGNGLRKLIGSKSEPLQFSSSLTTRGKAHELAGHSIKFFQDGTFKSYEYAP